MDNIAMESHHHRHNPRMRDVPKESAMATTARQEPKSGSAESQPAAVSAAQPAAAAKAEARPERHRMISEAAYFRSERRGFAPGADVEDWLAAEADIDREMQSGGSRSAHAATMSA